MYNIIAIAGKAGSGKDTILHKVIAAAPDRFNEIISATTRPPRQGEVDGVNYHFINNSQFGIKVKSNEMVEWTVFNGWGYGTPISSLVENKVNIGVFNPAGLRSLSASPQVHLAIVQIVAEDKTRLLRQLNREMSPNVKEIIRRFNTDEEDFKNFQKEFNNPAIILNEGVFGLTRGVDIIMDIARKTFG